MNNLAADPKHRRVLHELRQQVDAWMRQQGDRGLETERAVAPHQSVADDEEN